MSNQEAMFYPQETSRRQEGMGEQRQIDPREEAAYAEGYGVPGAENIGEKIHPVEEQRRSQQPPRQRRKHGWWIVLLLVVLLFSALAGGKAFFSRVNGVENRDFTLQAGQQAPHLIVNNGAGDVHVKVGNTDSVHIQATKYSFGLLPIANATVNYQQNGNTIEVTSNIDGVSFLNGADVDLEITVPAVADVNIVTYGGDIDLSNVNGKLDLKTMGGDVSLSNSRLSGASQIHTSGGDITLTQTNGVLQVETNGGTIRAENVALSGNSSVRSSGGDISFKDSLFQGTVEVNTSGGDIDFQGTLAVNGDYTFHTSGGKVTLNLPENSAFAAQLETTGGEVNNEFGSNVVGTGPKATIKASSSGGDINVRKGR